MHLNQCTVIDFETTGVAGGFPDEPWQIGIVRFQDGRPDPETCFSSLLRVQDRPFSPYAPGRHAKVRDQLYSAPALPEIWPLIQPFLGSGPLCAHNAATEKKWLQQAFPLHPLGPWVDTLKLVRVAYPALASHKLQDLIVKMQLKPEIDRLLPSLAPHDALYDAMACSVLLKHLLSLPAWRKVTLDTLVHASPERFHKIRSSRG